MSNSSIKYFGFPRWGEYGRNTDAEPVRMCDYVGCTEKGAHPAPKSPSSSERWYFCQAHAAQYNQNWNFFQGMSDEEARRFMDDGSESADAFAHARTFEWGGPAYEDGFSATEHAAFDTLEVDAGAGQDVIKRQYRKLAKRYHPDSNRGDPVAAERFHKIQAAYELLRQK